MESVAVDQIMPLSALRDKDIPLAGAKAARLGEMLAAGLPVPDGFCVTTDAYRNALALCPNEEPGTWLKQAPLPRQLEAAVRRSCAVWRGLPVAVRSSAVGEDAEAASFAGQHDSFLDVLGSEDVLEKLRLCWASLWTARAREYRKAQGIEEDAPALACVVQRMVCADVSGVMFTVDPRSGERDHMVINAVAGLADDLVSGRRDAEQYVLDKTSGDILQGPPDVALGLKPLLGRLAELGLRAEAHFGAPQDLEWAAEGNRLYLLQARPITVLPPPPVSSAEAVPPLLHYSERLSEQIPHALTPLAISILCDTLLPTIMQSFKHAGLVPNVPDSLLARLFRNVNGRPYAEVELMRCLFCPFTDIESFIEMIDGAATMSWRRLPLMPLLRLPLQQVRLWRKLRTLNAEVAAAIEVSVAHRRSLRVTEMSDEVLRDLLRGTYGDAPKQAEQTIILGNALGAQLIGPLHGHLARLLARWTDEPPGTAAMLVTGIPGIADVECSKCLWELSRHADSLRWNEFLQQWGHRASFEMEIMSPRWREDPRVPMQIVERLRDAPPEQSPAAIEQRNVQQREEAMARVMRKVRSGLHRTVLRTITRLLMDLTRVRQNTKSEALNYVDVLRDAAREWGRRLAERHRIDAAEDVYWLSVADLTESPDAPLHKRVRDGRRDYQRWRSWVAPRVIDGEGRAVRDFARKVKPGSLAGIGVSGGLARGRVRKVTDPTRISLAADEILVARYTDPTWTPLLMGARGVIAEVGSLLSHAAIVSRELGIPAVVCVHDAMQMFRDGDLVEIDGGTGAVRRIDNL